MSPVWSDGKCPLHNEPLCLVPKTSRQGGGGRVSLSCPPPWLSLLAYSHAFSLFSSNDDAVSSHFLQLCTGNVVPERSNRLVGIWLENDKYVQKEASDVWVFIPPTPSFLSRRNPPSKIVSIFPFLLTIQSPPVLELIIYFFISRIPYEISLSLSLSWSHLQLFFS